MELVEFVLEANIISVLFVFHMVLLLLRIHVNTPVQAQLCIMLKIRVANLLAILINKNMSKEFVNHIQVLIIIM